MIVENNNETWADYSKLVLKELERLNESQIKLKDDFDKRYSDINKVLATVQSIESKVTIQGDWMGKVSDVWSPPQMKEAKDELYAQKNKWVSLVAILTFIEIALGIYIATSK